MGRHKLPSNVKRLKNTYRKHRENQEEPISKESLGDAPDCLDEAQKKVWVELSNNAIEGVLTDTDRIIIEIIARLLSKLRTEGKLTVGEMGHLIGCLARIGFTPSDRAKISVKKTKTEKSPWEKFGS